MFNYNTSYKLLKDTNYINIDTGTFTRGAISTDIINSIIHFIFVPEILIIKTQNFRLVKISSYDSVILNRRKLRRVCLMCI